jgi:CRP-like cAMP-binding protein
MFDEESENQYNPNLSLNHIKKKEDNFNMGGPCLYFIITGKVQLYKTRKESINLQNLMVLNQKLGGIFSRKSSQQINQHTFIDKDFILENYEKEDYFGEKSLLFDVPRSESAKCVAATQLLQLSR